MNDNIMIVVEKRTRGHPRNQGAHLPLERLLGGVAQAQWECLQSLRKGHVVREQLAHFDELQCLNAPDQLRWDRREAAGEAEW